MFMFEVNELVLEMENANGIHNKHSKHCILQEVTK